MYIRLAVNCRYGSCSQIAHRNEFALSFDAAAALKPDLIRLIYSGRYSAQVSRVRPTKVVGAILSRLTR